MSDEDWLERVARQNLRHRATVDYGFRPGKLRGTHPSELRRRAKARAARAEWAPSVGEVVAMAGIAGGAYLFGRWWGRRRKMHQVKGDVGNRYLDGAMVLAA